MSKAAEQRREKVRVVEKFNLMQLVRKHIDELGIDDSFFITDVGDVVKKFLLWNELFPRISIDYAIKSNNLAAVASTLAALGELECFVCLYLNKNIFKSRHGFRLCEQSRDGESKLGVRNF
jgi:diaminopimelate decarboxylase